MLHIAEHMKSIEVQREQNVAGQWDVSNVSSIWQGRISVRAVGEIMCLKSPHSLLLRAWHTTSITASDNVIKLRISLIATSTTLDQRFKSVYFRYICHGHQYFVYFMKLCHSDVISTEWFFRISMFSFYAVIVLAFFEVSLRKPLL